MTGRTVLITGGTAGIGLATAIGLARLGASLALAGRDADRAEQASREVHTATGAHVDVFLADLSAQTEVRRLAEEVLQRLARVDVLVNNAGGYWDTRHLTEDGLERTFAVNHLAPFLLTHLLLGRLREHGGARVVTVASHAHAHGRIDFHDLQGEHSYSGARAYNQSKLANVMFNHELAKRLRGSSVTANAVHPGVVNTSFGAADPSRTQRLVVPILRPLMRSAERGAATSVHVASAPQLEGVSGHYFSNCRPRSPAPRGRDDDDAVRLWQTSANLVRLHVPGPPWP